MTVQPDAEVNGAQLSNGMPRRAAPLPSSSPPHLEVSALDQVDQEGQFSFSFLNGPPADPIYC